MARFYLDKTSKVRVRFALNGLVLPIELAQLLLVSFARLLCVALHGGDLFDGECGRKRNHVGFERV